MEFILLMYDDATDQHASNSAESWGTYLQSLRASGSFDGGSSVGLGVKVRKGMPDQRATGEWNGFIRVRANNLDDARRFLIGNPVYEAGGTVEIRELPPDE